VNNELETMSKEVVVAYVEVLSRHLFARTEETETCQVIRSSCRDLNPGPPEHEAGVLPLECHVGSKCSLQSITKAFANKEPITFDLLIYITITLS
jgi:hypothetical protein